MEPTTWQRVRELYFLLLEVPDEARERWLERECAGAPEVRGELERLTATESMLGDWLSPAAEVGWMTGASSRVLEPGTKIGRYRLRAMIGSGGMGEVYSAEQEHPRRLVAIKTLRAGVADEELLRRFRTEAEVLGHLRHPGVAQIYEAGTHVDGELTMPYLVMELIEGARSLVAHADSNQLDQHARLDLFVTVCEAVHHGHQKGVIHRDLKPGNVLVDAEGRPKVIDFGLARPLDPAGFEHSIVQTRAGEVLGTLAYMSPEHVSGQTFDIDVRSDVFSLGCILCELVTGAPPHDLEGLPLPLAVRRIAEDSAALEGRASGDLRWVLEKALAAEPERRYPSASELAADVRRLRRSEPVSAGPPSAFYRLSRFARRHRALLAGTLAVIVALSIGLLLARAEADNAERASVASYQQARVARTVSIFLTDLFDYVSAYESGEEARVIDAIRLAERKLPELEDPTVRAILTGIVGHGYLSLDDRERADPLLAEATWTLRGLLGPDDVQRLRIEVVYADLLEQQQRVQESKELSEEILPRLERTLGVDFETTNYLRYNLAVCCLRLGELDRAEVLFLTNLGFADAASPAGRRSIDSMNLLHKVGSVHVDQGRVDEALNELQEALALARTLNGVAPLYEATILMDLAGAQLVAGDEVTALQSYRAADRLYDRLRPTNSNRLGIAVNLAWCLLANGEPGEAAEQLVRAHEVLEAGWSEPGFRHVALLRLEAAVLSAEGEHFAAESAALEAVALAEEVLGEGSPWTGRCRETLAEVQGAAGEVESEAGD